MNNIELLMPAGNIEKMRYAFFYGADACYLGMVDYSLRTMRKGELITRDNLKIAVDEARRINKKVYLIFLHMMMILKNCMKILK